MRRSYSGEVLLGVAAVALVLALSRPGMAVSVSPRSYAGECDDGCSQEEVRELYASYKEECIGETNCSQEEINELSGGGSTNQNAMMNAFLRYQWYIRAQDISTSAMVPNAAWLYSQANYSGLLYQVWGSVDQSVPNLSAAGFNDSTDSLRIGPWVYLATYDAASYKSAQLVVSANQPSLTAPFLNSISSARVSLFTNPFSDPRQNLAQAVRQVVATVGAPALPGSQASRSDAGIDGSFVVHLDIGGEGLKDCYGEVSGFASSMNLNDTATITTCGASRPPIPNLVLLQPWSTNPTYPFADGFADYITMQGAPLTPTNVAEITRTLRVGGTVALWVDVDINQSGIDQLAANLKTTPQYDVYDEFGGKTGNPKTLIVDNR